MDAKVVYWTAAWLNFSLLLAYVVVGVRRVRSGQVAGHRRAMIIASGLVVLFLLSYLLKLEVLGREDLSLWLPRDVTVLRLHETCVFLMVLAGSLALILSRRMRSTRNVTRDAKDPVAPAGLLRTHRLAGRTAAVGALFGWLSAALVLMGMWSR